MKYCLTILALMAFEASAGTLKFIYKNDQAPLGYRYLAEFKNDISESRYTVAFGDGMKYQVYGTELTTFQGGVSRADSDQTILTSTGVSVGKVTKATFTTLNGVKIYEGTYTLHDSASSKQFAMNVDKAVVAEFTKDRTMDNPATPAELRRIIKQLKMDLYYSDAPEEFPTFDLQIESYISITPPNAQKATANVTMAGTDLISKEILGKGNKWFSNNSEAYDAVVEMIEANRDLDGKVFASFSNKVQYAGLSTRLKKAISKHLKVEILEEDGFDCEDSVYNWTSATWILKDGSSMSYSPGTECD